MKPNTVDISALEQEGKHSQQELDKIRLRMLELMNETFPEGGLLLKMQPKKVS
jgi:hypothetical protein